MRNVELALKTELEEYFAIDGDKISNDSDFAADLGFDSLDYVELLMIAEENFDIEITDEDAEKVRTFGEFVALIESYKV